MLLSLRPAVLSHMQEGNRWLSCMNSYEFFQLMGFCNYDSVHSVTGFQTAGMDSCMDSQVYNSPVRPTPPTRPTAMPLDSMTFRTPRTHLHYRTECNFEEGSVNFVLFICKVQFTYLIVLCLSGD